ncbi:MAG: carbohydrate-binding protein, partial [Cohnella sp.]|nr:carbohydrate-binding protein [Cohnella sp.]
TVHVVVWGIDNTGTQPSTGPYVVHEGDYQISNGQITVSAYGMNALSAYQMIVTPNRDLSPTTGGNRYEAEFASHSGTAFVSSSSNTGYSGTSFIEGYGGGGNAASVDFVVTAPSNGYYNVALRYSAGGLPSTRTARMTVNGSALKDLSLPGTADWNTWATSTTKVYLQAGINRIGISTYTPDNADAINIDYLDLASSTGTVTAYQAEASGNTLGGSAVRTSDSAASGGQYVGWIGGGAANTLQFNNVNVPSAGVYRLIITYANGELGDGATNYNTNVVDRYSDITVNGAGSQKVYFRNTLGWSNYRTTVVNVNLNAGNNTIKFGNSSTGYAPNIDLIQIASPLG